MIPSERIRLANEAEIRPGGNYVLYWMTAARRTRSNFALERAVDLANELGRPLVVLEALRVGYRWASDRFHSFVLEGMRDNAEACARQGVSYFPYVERSPGDGKGLLAALSASACAVVTDDFPAFFLPRMIAAAARSLDVRLEVVDSNGILPLARTNRVFPTAYSFRRFVHAEFAGGLPEAPLPDPLADLRAKETPEIDAGVRGNWPAVSRSELEHPADLLAALPIDHSVGVTKTPGGAQAAGRALDRFAETRLDRYDADRNTPDLEGSSGLSPYLHFGHISSFDVVERVLDGSNWTPAAIDGSRAGQRPAWGLDDNRRGFLDQIVTWRELGFATCANGDDFDSYEGLPDWARVTLSEHEGDVREWVYELEQFERGQTHDDLWNAVQNQLVRDGVIHNYLRMLWGKKILEWSESPRDALQIMIELNNKYAIDGRDPNSYSGITWVLGRYDRAWGPERPVFGKVRFMSSANTARKVKLRGYLERHGNGALRL